MAVIPRLVFGTAVCAFPTGYHTDWDTGVALRRRPEQDGADVGTMGKEPRLCSIQGVLTGTTVVGMITLYQRWLAEKGNINTVHTTEPIALRGEGVVLLSVNAVTGIRRVLNATNGANYIQWINLVFARVRATTPTT